MKKFQRRKTAAGNIDARRHSGLWRALYFAAQDRRNKSLKASQTAYSPGICPKKVLPCPTSSDKAAWYWYSMVFFDTPGSVLF
jgi:hypothetical protein